MTPVEILQAWFAAHRDGDMDAARKLLAPGAPIILADRTVTGLDGLLGYFAERAAQRPDFSYSVADVLAGTDHAAAVLELVEGERRWRQIALYTVREGQIASIWAVEEDNASGRRR